MARAEPVNPEAQEAYQRGNYWSKSERPRSPWRLKLSAGRKDIPEVLSIEWDNVYRVISCSRRSVVLKPRVKLWLSELPDVSNWPMLTKFGSGRKPVATGALMSRVP